MKRGDVLIGGNILAARREMLATFGYKNFASESLKPSVVKAEADAEKRAKAEADAASVVFGPRPKPRSFLERLGGVILI
ncbi:MAG: hypothetical protein HZB76_00010 [Chlamydiae bacterium]|nr:hypothetical protein [Chlamydiota bacterium]